MGGKKPFNSFSKILQQHHFHKDNGTLVAANCYCGNKKADDSICFAVDAESITIITATVLMSFVLVMEPMATVVR